MAITGHFEAAISVDDEVLQEYDCETDSSTSEDQAVPVGSKVKKCIEVQEGNDFTITLLIAKEYVGRKQASDVCWDLLFDGAMMDGWVACKTHAGKRNRICHVKCVYTRVGGELQAKYFSFKPLATSEEAVTNIDQLEKYKSFGTIEVQVWPFQKDESSLSKKDKKALAMRESTFPRTPGQSGASSTVPEKAVKARAVTLGVKLDTKKQNRRKKGERQFGGQRIGEHPIAHFIFEYRTKKSLQELMVIPRSPSPEPITPLTERDPTTLSREELEEVIAILKTRIKKEPNKSIKRERDVSPANSNEIVFLREKKLKTTMAQTTRSRLNEVRAAVDSILYIT